MTDEELLDVFKHRLVQSGPLLWVVWTNEAAPGGRSMLNLPKVRLVKLIAAKSAPEARKVWREAVFASGGEVPQTCEAVSVPYGALDSIVVSEGISERLQRALGLE